MKKTQAQIIATTARSRVDAMTCAKYIAYTLRDLYDVSILLEQEFNSRGVKKLRRLLAEVEEQAATVWANVDDRE